MIKVIINGASGKMGKKVYDAISRENDMQAVCGVALEDDFSNKDFPIYSSYEKVSEKADVIIDFSSAVTLPMILDYAIKNKIGAVLCSTGYNGEDIQKINKAAEIIPIFRSANMSVGVNVLIQAVKAAAKTLDGFDVEIIEKHHNQKIDAPSGTALMLADAVKEIRNDDYYVYGREGVVGKRNANEIGIHAVRGGSIVGEHDVIFAGIDETITFSHLATDRNIFANGAVKAAKFLVNKEKGLFNMSDLIGNKNA